MIQNLGELIYYIGGALCVLFVIGLFVIRILSSMGKITLTNRKGIVLFICLIVGIVLIFVGDSYRKDMSKDVMLSYYEKNIPFAELTKAQIKNIDVSVVNLQQQYKKGEDVSKYLPALDAYAKDWYQSKGISEEDSQGYAESLMEGFTK